MAMKVTRKEFLGNKGVCISSPQVLGARVRLKIEIFLYRYTPRILEMMYEIGERFRK